MFGWFNTHLTELMRKPHGLNIILGPGRISTFAHFHVHVIQASFCLSSGMATVHREDRVRAWTSNPTCHPRSPPGGIVGIQAPCSLISLAHRHSLT